MKHAKEYLKKIGVASDVIEQLFTEEPTEDFDVTESAKEFVKKSRTLAKDDPELIRSIRDEIRGTELSKIEHKIKKTFDLSAEDVRDKKFDEILDFAKSRIQETAGSTSDELQRKIVELNNQVKQYEEEILPAERNKAKETINTFRKDTSIASVLAKRAANLIVVPEAILPAINQRLNENFNVNVNDSGDLEVKTKDGLNPLNADGTKVLTFDEIIDNYLTELKVIKQSNADPNNQVKTTTTPASNPEPDSKPKFNLRGLQTAQENAERLKEMKVFGG